MRKHEGWPSVLLGREGPQTMLSCLLAHSLQRHCGGAGGRGVGLWASTSPPTTRCPLCLSLRSSPVWACPQLPETAKRSIFVLFRKGVACNHLHLNQTISLTVETKMPLLHPPLPILLHLPCPQSLSNWGRFLEWKLCDKLWPNHKTQQELKVTK